MSIPYLLQSLLNIMVVYDETVTLRNVRGD